MRNKIILGSRGSELAMVQADSVAALFRKIYPGLEVSITRIVTQGDRNRRTPLDLMPGDGVFVRELEKALLDGTIDLAVHSLKDVPTRMPHGLCLAAVPERLDPRDVLVCRAGSLAELPPSSKIGTGSLRRAVQLSRLRPDLVTCGIRGNVDTRLRKVARGEIDGVILAAAGLIRLGRQDSISEYLPLEHFLPAVGQGALAIEARQDDESLLELATAVNHIPTWQSVSAERAFLASLGGGCRMPMAALAAVRGDTLRISGMVADTSGAKMLHDSEEGEAASAAEIGRRLAQKMLTMGASELIGEAKAR